MNEHDKKMLEAVRAFNPYDLYSKSDEVPDTEKLKVSLNAFSKVAQHAVQDDLLTRIL